MSVSNIIDISRLKELIDTKTREEIAEGIGCDTSTVTKHYTESRAVNIKYLKKYAEFFNVSTDYLLGMTENPEAAEIEALRHQATADLIKRFGTGEELKLIEFKKACLIDSFYELYELQGKEFIEAARSITFIADKLR